MSTTYIHLSFLFRYLHLDIYNTLNFNCLYCWFVLLGCNLHEIIRGKTLGEFLIKYHSSSLESNNIIPLGDFYFSFNSLCRKVLEGGIDNIHKKNIQGLSWGMLESPINNRI